MAKKAKKKSEDDATGKNGDVADNDEGAKKKGGKGKLIVIIIVALIVVLGGTGGGLFYLGFLDSMLGIEHEEADTGHENADHDPLDLGTPVYYELPEFVADLKTNECRSPFLKLSLTVQIDQGDQAVLVERQPKVIDRIQLFLREQERQALVGEAGAEALRAEVVLIMNATIQPATIQNVLFRSMILQ